MHRVSVGLCSQYVCGQTDHLCIESLRRKRERIAVGRSQKTDRCSWGWPAGLYAAWTCAARGHRVILLEKGNEMGGSFRVASYPTGKGQISAAIRAMIVRCQKSGVEMCINTEATPESIRLLAPDAVILATGSTPLLLPIPGLSDCGYITAQDMLAGKFAIGKKVVIAGGGMIGCEAAEFLAERGHQVAIVEMKPTIAEDVTPENRRYMFENFERNHVLLYPNAKIARFYPDGVACTMKDGSQFSLREYDNIILAMGTRASNPLGEGISKFVPQVFVIGEAQKSPGNAVTVTTDAFNVALAIS